MPAINVLLSMIQVHRSLYANFMSRLNNSPELSTKAFERKNRSEGQVQMSILFTIWQVPADNGPTGFAWMSMANQLENKKKTS
jgi:hypothetical protein